MHIPAHVGAPRMELFHITLKASPHRGDNSGIYSGCCIEWNCREEWDRGGEGKEYCARTTSLQLLLVEMF